jgi:hypothetical protein
LERRALGPALVLLLVASCSVVDAENRDAASPARSGALESLDARARLARWRDVVAPRSEEGTPEHADAPRVVVGVPGRASGETAIEDDASHMSARVTLRGATDAPLVAAGGIAVYPGAYAGGDVFTRVTRGEVEDFVVFEARPAREELVYEVDVSRAAGLRLVSGVLELLDSGGAPRLRVRRPYVTDDAGHTLTADLAVEGCAYDESPAPPWGRAVTAPRASRCTLVVSWHGVRYPAIVDPAWASTGSMTQARRLHTAILLASGQVLVAGGLAADGAPPRNTAELYDPKTGTFAATGAMTVGLSGAQAVRLASGTVLIAAPSTTQLYQPAAGTFSASAASAAAGGSVTLLASGKVLLVNGTNAAVYDPASRVFTPTTGAPAFAHVGPTAALLASGKVLVAAGPTKHAELFDPLTGTFGTGGTTSVPRSEVAAVLPSGKVLIAGGASGSADLYDPAKNSFDATGAMKIGRVQNTVTVLGSGHVLFTSGVEQGGISLQSNEVYADGAFAFSAPYIAMKDHAATLLADQRVLVTGGDLSFMGFGSPQAAVLTIVPNGAKCALGSECESGECVEGLCCDSPCSSRCQACDVPGSLGRCVPVKGAPHGARGACARAGTTCGGSCDGAFVAACTFPAGGTSCGSACVSGVIVRSACNGNGSCAQLDPQACEGHLACADASSCKPSCTTSDDCVAGYLCGPGGVCASNALCLDEHTSESALRTKAECAPYRCDVGTGACRTTCNSVDDCHAPAACDQGGRCVALPVEEHGGCAVALASSRNEAASVALALGAATLLLRRRRRGR